MKEELYPDSFARNSFFFKHDAVAKCLYFFEHFSACRQFYQRVLTPLRTPSTILPVLVAKFLYPLAIASGKFSIPLHTVPSVLSGSVLDGETSEPDCKNLHFFRTNID